MVGSLINLGSGGEVSDYVHYHKVKFQVIYCWHGKVKVVYEDLGDPFWLHPGDCVLQPPEMRHRVLECCPNTSVIELTSPAVHETWSDHDMVLPTGKMVPDRVYGGQHFVLHRAPEAGSVSGSLGNFEKYDSGIQAATNRHVQAFELRTRKTMSSADIPAEPDSSTFYFVLGGKLTVEIDATFRHDLEMGDSITLPVSTAHTLNASPNSAILAIKA